MNAAYRSPPLIAMGDRWPGSRQGIEFFEMGPEDLAARLKTARTTSSADIIVARRA